MRISDWSSDVCSSDLLDAILGGGLDPDRMYLYEGRPGTGQTTIALQFLLEGVRRGERVLYITLSGTRRELALVAKRHAWTVDGIVLFGLAPPETSLGPGRALTILQPTAVRLKIR